MSAWVTDQRAARGLAQFLIGLEHELELEGQACVTLDRLAPCAGDERDFVHRHALHLDIEPALGIRRAGRFRQRLEYAIGSVGAQVEGCLPP